MARFGIDISSHQGNFDIDAAIKAHGVQFAMLKVAGGDKICYRDKQFASNYAKCKKAGIPVGCYFFGHALTMQKAKEEVAYWLDAMAGYQFDFPVIYDVEGDALKIGRRTLTDIVKYIMSELEKHGYWVGIYASLDTFNNVLYDVELRRYTHWVACWSKNKPVLKYGGAVQIWQNSSSNIINGQRVDTDYCYVDYYEATIKKRGLNGYGLSNLPAEHKKKTTREIALEVIDGKWGNGAERKQRLTAAGYNYKTVQNMVNKILKEGK